ncbi:hypothetical protein GE21DRAFT_9395 [Neurospora crassa]|uniref:Uncharacterized protein n=1 Tax=Neurospora crassa (strain ATCC 24698 / 74-OR23-1A / CBS 708.71 / DSM 1257 / FGSC 987) TaxID=367110 RepID=Q7S2C7_NEUCR|nr:hypothetical protein NCU05951 [Neurospora crassa OR74A]EAA29559.2 hypothetical protein NCU05951 [Neurospora crassa OR74A]KHE87522.1 hypothetical protein GE21DRAFT_9395 [Neurospora crassa]|eukprot:XP_958795.2 hypothetical protein NCU05951 [Neurospora crassa OR74A]
MNPSLNATMNDASFLIPPTRFLFQPAHRPKYDIGTLASPGRRGLLGLAQRDLTCASDETTCTQGSWCCGNGSTCSLDNGAFFCCPPEAGQDGCARVCATGDFQCGNVCCADGQTCMGADSGSPYCVNPSTTSNTLMSSVPLPTTPTTTTALISSTVAHTTPTMMTTASSSVSTTSDTAVPFPSSMSSSQTAAASTTVSPSPDREGGIPMAAQISIGVIVPVFCIFLVFGLWMVLFRRSKSRRLSMGDAPGEFPPRFHVVAPSDLDRPSSYYPTTPPPAYTKSATTLDSTVPAASSAATSVYGNESLAPEQGMEMSTLSVPLSPSPRLPPLDQRLSVMDVRLSVASTTVGTPEHEDQAGHWPQMDGMHPGSPVDPSRATVYYPRHTVDQSVDHNGVRPGTAL